MKKLKTVNVYKKQKAPATGAFLKFYIYSIYIISVLKALIEV